MKLKLCIALLLFCFIIQAPAAVAAAGSGPFEICISSYSNNSKSVLLKYNKITGQAWLFNKQRYEGIPEKKSIPPSLYKITIMPYQQGWFAARLDTRTGKTWKLKNRMWVEFK